jgi:hypothetical protein
LPEVEAPNGAVARGKGRIISSHAALAELTALFGMANQRFDTSAAILKAGVGLRTTLRQRAGIEPGLLKTEFLQPFQRLQVLAIGTAVIAFVHPGRGQDPCAKKVLMCFDHRADGSFVFHPDRCARSDKEEIASTTTKLKGAPKLEPFGRLALVEAAHSLSVKGERFVWDDDPTSQKARHMEKVGRAVRIDLIQ